MQRLVLSIILTIALAGDLSREAQSQAEDIVAVSIVSVIDGFTVHVMMSDGSDQVLRLSGINAPENPAPGLPPPCFAPESTAHLAELVAGREATLEFDTGREDRAGRLLGYLWLADEAGEPWMVNERLVREGYAGQIPVAPNLRYAERFSAAEQVARNQGLGLWTVCAQPGSAGSAMPVPPAPGEPVPPSTLLPGRPQVCDAAYPTVCIPPPPPSLNCNEIRYRRFPVLPPDPHHFDPDENGIGCDK